MTNNNFQKYFDRLIGYEGGYVNDPADPGGETNWGISKRAYPNLIIKDLTREDAYNIYKRDFWDVIKGDTIPDALAFQVFDFAVNSGMTTAIRYLQKAIHVADDGNFGVISQAKLKSMSEIQVIMNLNGERLNFMTNCDDWATEGKGWARRIAQNLQYNDQD